MAFGREGAVKGDPIVLAATAFKVDRKGGDREVLEYFVRERAKMKMALKNSRRVKVLESKNAHSNLKGVNCVRYSNKLQNVRRGPNGIQYVKNSGYICRQPSEKTLFMLLELSERSGKPEFNAALRKIGDSFSAGVKFDDSGL